MHTSAYKTGKQFFDTYCNFGSLRVVEIGSRNVNSQSCLKDVITPNIVTYSGLDHSEGNGVDFVLEDPYKYPFEDNSVDVVVSTSCYEHAEMFWLSYLESMRILRPTGVLYINAPSSWMGYHRCPIDCWRFFPDAAKGLETWGKYNKLNNMVLETFIVPPVDEDMSDWVAVFLKDANYEYLYRNRIIDSLESYKDYFNGFRFPKNERFLNGWDWPDSFYHQAVKVNFLNTYKEGDPEFRY
jgi:SAM-dependent methyltransferase